MRKEIYLSLIERLSSIMAADGSAAIRHIDLWNENVSFIAEEVFAMPAVFVEFGAIEWKQLSQGDQTGLLDIRLHIVTLASESAARHRHIQALDYFDLIDRITAAVSTMSRELFGPLHRIRSQTNHNHEGILDSVEVFRCHIYQNPLKTE